MTPDSFSDGGAYFERDAAVDRALQMIDEGADIVDVGPESTRPGSSPVSVEEQIRRAAPVIEGIRRHNVAITISIDTRLAPVAQAALEAGANMINDISALREDEEMAGLAAKHEVPVVLMHMRGRPLDMQAGGGPQYDDVVGEVRDFLEQRRDHAVACGIEASRIVLDPGLGFGKRREDNLLLLKNIDRLADLGHPVLIGASRKSFIGEVLDLESPDMRLAGSIACALLTTTSGADILRVHDVKETVEAMRMFRAVREAGNGHER